MGAVKRREPRAGGKRGTLAGLPPNLPPLLMAIDCRSERPASALTGQMPRAPMEKVKEEVGELRKSRERGVGSRSKKSSGTCFSRP